MPILTFQEALEETHGRNRNLLIGNGFSIEQSGNDFTYGNLLECSGIEEGSAIRNVFEAFDTADFEEVMSALEHAAKVERAYEDKAKAKQFALGASEVRKALIRAIRTVHPKIQSDIPDEQMESCAQFLNEFKEIFSLNYDLLLYWTILNHDDLGFSDGFGLGEEEDGFRTFSKEAHCEVYYPHGALHLFLGEQRETQKKVRTGNTILKDIEHTIRERRRLPLIVSEATSSQKMAKINSVPYLRHVFDSIKKQSDCLFVFGHSADDRDAHIYSAISASDIKDLYFCVHDPENNLATIKHQLSQFMKRSKNINVHYVDSATADVWGRNE